MRRRNTRPCLRAAAAAAALLSRVALAPAWLDRYLRTGLECVECVDAVAGTGARENEAGDIVEEYSENVVLTLHQKNLLLLGEDRFLSMLMLQKLSENGKMMFAPQTVCHSVVPNEFKILLSQRRR
ncbi:Chitin synthase, class 3 [Chytriomyces hyalinus]|nr:Chitin synthase, class 3 [Chytriomyces hyalinus]